MVVLRSVGFVRQMWRNSPWIVIAVAFHAVAIAVISIVTIRALHTAPSDVGSVSFVRKPPIEKDLFPQIEEKPIVREAVPPDDERQLVDTTTEYLPEPDPLADLSRDPGDPLADTSDVLPGSPASTSIGVGTRGHVGTGVTPLRPTRDLGLHRPGGAPIAPPEQTERAVLAGLTWLVRHQASDGSWSIAGLRERCLETNSCLPADAAFSSHYDEGLTGLALLAFLGAGFGHNANVWIVDTVKARKHKVGDVVKAGLNWLAKRQKDDGSFSAERPFMYNEALATMAMCEAYGLTHERKWKASAQRGVDFLVRAQKRNPQGQGFWGWRYSPREDAMTTLVNPDDPAGMAMFQSDTSVTTWVVMALKSADLCGLTVPRESLDGALAYIQWVSKPNGTAGYLDPLGAAVPVGGINEQYAYHIAVMSALSMCSRIFIAHDPKDPFLDAAAAWLVRDLPAVSRDRLSIDYYYWYYGSLALNQLDGPDSPRRSGKYWGPWNKAMVESLIALQDDAPRACSKGGWLVPDRWSYAGGPVYATALNVLTLEVYYRYANAFGMPRGGEAMRKPGGK